jgi:uncharacterized protein YdcH (DUF465 family)
MPKPILSHSLAIEFPELADTIHALMVSDANFKHLLAKHDVIDRQITDSEDDKHPLDDEAMKALKIERLHLKEQLNKIALQHKR